MEIEVENLASEAYVKLSDIDMCGQTAVQAGVKSVKMSPETKMGNREAQLTLEIDSLRRAYYLAYQRAERAEALIYG